ncbi:type II toxin-antitoxin system prevent-host-death family antitoxin [Ornithinimicrobium ciconiae]|uniref:Antitoxin n=1 Tax=Ornithinimicrobium ciconiae TaxID=2594265 RepID=A0A516GC05_9MICO|nr:type II toxin-antitoxin system prevent-host-death family antitoxin [Ornithinimicrobium ciconiae]QDO89065.1 type II toxin-antitoxin system prevent-host-death family antitoxin [Ornithinimicrobium ciconiae]
METIPHRDLRNHSSEILARVSAGESIAVTNHGQLAAIISPPTSSPLEQARRAGRVREPRRRVDLTTIRRARLNESSAEVLADLRGDR